MLKPTVGLEPTTYGLQNRCSTIELRRLGLKKATGQDRTGDLLFTKQLLYRLSYSGKPTTGS